MLIITNIHYFLKFSLSISQGIPHSAQMFQNTDFVRHNTPQPRPVADDNICTSEPNQPVANTAQILSKVSVVTEGRLHGEDTIHIFVSLYQMITSCITWTREVFPL